MKGLEPPRLTALDPKSSSATNYDTSAKNEAQRYTNFLKYKICIPKNIFTYFVLNLNTLFDVDIINQS